jgi:hypothetical protein
MSDQTVANSALFGLLAIALSAWWLRPPPFDWTNVLQEDGSFTGTIDGTTLLIDGRDGKKYWFDLTDNTLNFDKPPVRTK